MTPKTAIFPGSFDPFTIGHESLVQRSLAIFDKVIIAIGHNSTKKSLFSIENREKWIKKLFQQEKKVEVKLFSGLTVDFCSENNAGFILRGLRTSADFEYERAIAQNNKTLNPAIDTIFILATPDISHINSTIVREIYINKGDLKKFVPEIIYKEINALAT